MGGPVTGDTPECVVVPASYVAWVMRRGEGGRGFNTGGSCWWHMGRVTLTCKDQNRELALTLGAALAGWEG